MQSSPTDAPAPGPPDPAIDLLSAVGDEVALLGAGPAAPAHEQQAAPLHQAASGTALELGDPFGSLDGWPTGSPVAAVPVASSGGHWDEEQLSDVESMASGDGELAGQAAAAGPAAAEAAAAEAAAAGVPAVEMPAFGPDLSPQSSLGGLSDVSTETDAGSANEGSVTGAAEGPQPPAAKPQPVVQRPAQQLSSEAAQGLPQQLLHLDSGHAAAMAGRAASPGGSSPRAGAQEQQRQQGALQLDVPPPLEQPAAATEQPGEDTEDEGQGRHESLLQAAERLEARLAAGSSASEGPGSAWAPGSQVQQAAGRGEEAAYQLDLLLASIISQVGAGR